MEGFSKYFTFEELTDTSHKNLLTKNRLDAMRYINSGKRLSKLLQSIREVLGNYPITITSGFRNSDVNLAVGSRVTTSSHTKFEAADIIPSNISVKGALDKIMLEVKNRNLQDLKKVIIEQVGGKKWLHIQVKMSSEDQVSFWATTDGKNYTQIS